jgi:tetratricopeptide (TPR) repeat protein
MSQQNLNTQPDEKSKALFEKASELHQNMELEKAEYLYRSLLNNNDNNQDVLYYKLGIVCIQTERYTEAIEFFKKSLQVKPDVLDVLNNLAIAYIHNQEPSKAKEAYKRALLINPNHPFILNNLATIEKDNKNFAEAERLFQKAICFKLDYVEAHNNLGMLYSVLARIEEAIAKFQEALRHDPNWASAYNNLGNAYKDKGDRENAEEYFRKAIEKNPNFDDAYNNLGNILRGKVQLDEAKACFKKALELNPDNHNAFYNLMMLMEFSHQLDEAEALLKELKEKNPDHPAITFLAARLARRKGNIDEGIKIIESKGIQDGQIGMYTQFELGQLHDRAGNAAKAFAAFKKGNELHMHSPEYQYVDLDIYPDLIAENKKVFNKEWIKSWTPYKKSPNHPTPIFIVGFPRSGTTLLDQILSSHPDFFVVEEKPAIEKLRFDLFNKYGNNAACLANLSSEEIEHMRGTFYKTHSEYNDWDGKGYFVDKFPMSTALAGIIYRIFPDAKFIFALRHPYDCVLSCFMQQFQINTGMAHFLKLESAAAFYDQMMDLWIYFQEVLPLNIYTHRYEDVVEDFKPTIAKLLKFLEVPWDDAVLEYDKTAKKRKTLASTPSYNQVTEKIYTRAKYRWTRYQEELAPVLDTLRPYAKTFGYPTEKDI